MEGPPLRINPDLLQGVKTIKSSNAKLKGAYRAGAEVWGPQESGGEGGPPPPERLKPPEEDQSESEGGGSSSSQKDQKDSDDQGASSADDPNVPQEDTPGSDSPQNQRGPEQEPGESGEESQDGEGEGEGEEGEDGEEGEGGGSLIDDLTGLEEERAEEEGARGSDTSSMEGEGEEGLSDPSEGMEDEVEKSIEEAAREMQKRGLTGDEINKHLGEVAPIKRKKSAPFNVSASLPGAAQSWEKQLRNKLATASGVQDIFNPAAPSRRIEGQLGRSVEVEDFANVIIMLDTSSSLPLRIYKKVLQLIRVFFLRYRVVFQNARIHACTWSNHDMYDYTSFKGLGTSKFKKINPGLESFEHGTEFAPHVVRIFRKCRRPDLYICCTDGEFNGTDEGMQEEARKLIKKVIKKTVWVVPGALKPSGRQGFSFYDKTYETRLVEFPK